MILKTVQLIFPGVLLLLTICPLSAQWVRMSGPWGGEISDLIVNDGTVFAGGAYGIYRSVDNGENWTRSDDCSIGGILDFAVKDSSVYVGSFGGFLVTHDNGRNWTDLSEELPGGFEFRYNALCRDFR